MYTQCVKRTLAHGTTTASYYGTIHVEATNILADICLDLGQRAFIGKVGLIPKIALISGLHESIVPRLLSR